MKFSTREDVSAPVEQVFAALCDVTRFERAALRRGARLRRLDDLPAPAPGMAWDMAFRFRGKPRNMVAQIRRLDPPALVEYAGASANVELSVVVSLLALSRTQTRMHVELLLRPRSLGARLLVQSARLARPRLTRKYAEAVRRLARDIETRAAR